MKPPHRAAAAMLLALLALGAARAHAQGPDARVLPRGMLELRALGLFVHHEEVFAGGGRRRLGAPLEPALQAAADRLTGPGVAGLRTELERFFAGTEGSDTPPEVTAGSAELGLAGDVRLAPVTLAYGLTRRLTVEVTFPIERHATAVFSNRLAGGSVGLNPDSARNRTLLERVGGDFADLGRQRFLPTAGSAAGTELQRRVQALLGDTVSLVLPERAVAYQDLLAIPALRALVDSAEVAALNEVSRGTGGYRLGDVEVGGRLLLAGPPGLALPADTPGARSFRATVGARARLPTGPRSATLFLLEIPAEAGHAGAGADLTADVASRRWWVSGTAGFELLLPADVRRLDFSAGPFPDTLTVVTLRREPGARLGMTVVPRYRLTREISFAGSYAFAAVGATTFSGGGDDGALVLGPFEVAEAWTAHRVGIGMSYATTTAHAAGQARAPFELSLRVERTVAGSGGVPAAGIVTMGGRIFYQAIGRAPRPVPEAPPPPPPPAEPELEPVRIPVPPEPVPPPAPPPPPPPSRQEVLPVARGMVGAAASRNPQPRLNRAPTWDSRKSQSTLSRLRERVGEVYEPG